MTRALTHNTPRPQDSARHHDWRVVTPLLLWSAFPMAAGLYELLTPVTGAPPLREDARPLETAVPIAVHVISCTLFVTIGAFQLAPALRSARPRWHRILGRALLPIGVSAALSGLWLSFVGSLPETEGPALALLRLCAAVGWVDCLVLGCAAILRRDVAAHRAWMIRAYAFGQSAGTQTVLLLGWISLVGALDTATNTVLMGAGWALNLLVAEAFVRRRVARSAQQPLVGALRAAEG
jgi:uncharacterized membrane protein